MPATLKANVKAIRDGHGLIYCYQVGQKVQKALTAEGIEHIPLVHPAARGKIRLRANYIAHVVSTMTEALGHYV